MSLRTLFCKVMNSNKDVYYWCQKHSIIGVDSLVVRPCVVAAANRVCIPKRITFFYSQWQYLIKFESEQGCILLVPKTFLSIVVDSFVERTLPCGRTIRVCIHERAIFFFSVAAYLNKSINSFMTLLFARY